MKTFDEIKTQVAESARDNYYAYKEGWLNGEWDLAQIASDGFDGLSKSDYKAYKKAGFEKADYVATWQEVISEKLSDHYEGLSGEGMEHPEGIVPVKQPD